MSRFFVVWYSTAAWALAALALMASPAGATQEDYDDGVSDEKIAAFRAQLAAMEYPDDTPPPPSSKLDLAQTRTAIGPARQARRQPTGVLSGRIVYTGAGHGWTYDDENPGSGLAWFTQRGNNNSVVEDYGNQAQMTLFAAYCWNAGATVVATRPIGFQSNEVLVDQEAATYFPSLGAWSTSTGSPYFSTTAVGVSDAIHYRFIAANTGSETAFARYTPNIPEAGYYPVYTWVLNSTNRVNQLYRVNHTGGSTEVRVNHRMVGKGWVWLGTYYFEAGTSGNVEISNHVLSGETGTSIIADGIRFGNGMGDLDFGEGVSGFPREEEASRYWAQISTGKDSSGDRSTPSVWDGSTSHQNDNVGTPPRWIAYMNDDNVGSDTDRIYISFHSNAGGGRGADGLINPSVAEQSPNQPALAELLGREINEDMRQLDTVLFSDYTEWTNTTGHTFTGSFNFGEQRYSAIDQEMDLCIIEVAFHDSTDDTMYLNDAKARRLIARSTMQAVIRYFNQFGGGALNMPPDEPLNLRALNATDGTGDIILNWDAPVQRISGAAGTPGNIGGDAPTGYVVYTSTDGMEFDVATTLGSTTSHRLMGLSSGATVYAYVTATNAGGESFPSNIAGARVHGTRPPILVVDGFDRLDRFSPLNVTISGISGRSNLGTFHRIDPRRINDYSYVVPTGNAIAGGTVVRSFDYALNDDVIDGTVSLDDYDTVIWILGEESTADETFNGTEQTLVANFLAGGGNLFLSGAEIAWDLDRASGPSAADRAFINNQLRADYVGDDSDTFSVQGSAGNIFSAIGTFSFDDGTNEYEAEFPDQLSPVGTGASVAMTYVGGTGGNAAIVYDGSVGGGRVVFFGFPFETITSATTREEIMDAILNFFSTPVPVGFSGFAVE